jgi:hypothetical protein
MQRTGFAQRLPVLPFLYKMVEDCYQIAIHEAPVITYYRGRFHAASQLFSEIQQNEQPMNLCRFGVRHVTHNFYAPIDVIDPKTTWPGAVRVSIAGHDTRFERH